MGYRLRQTQAKREDVPSQCRNVKAVSSQNETTASRCHVEPPPLMAGHAKLTHRQAKGYTPPEEGVIPDLRSIVEEGRIGRADKALGSCPLPFTQVVW
jgi:hypothetical protein